MTSTSATRTPRIHIVLNDNQQATVMVHPVHHNMPILLDETNEQETKTEMAILAALEILWESLRNHGWTVGELVDTIEQE